MPPRPLALTLVAGPRPRGLHRQGRLDTARLDGRGAGGPITVNATDTACELSATTAKAGTVTFQVANTGSKVNEFYVYGEGDRIVAEVENITPGLNRELKVEITQPGTFTTACKPGMVGDGIRGAFTVTGTAVSGSADQKVAKAITDYKAFVAAQSDELFDGTEAFVAAVKAGDVAKAKSLYPRPASPWEAIEPVAESFGDLDPKHRRPRGRRRGRHEVHRLPPPREGPLGHDGLQKDSSAIADQLLTDVREIAARSKTVEPTALTIANGAKALLDEVATGKITGEEERYSHTDLWDFRRQPRRARSQALACCAPWSPSATRRSRRRSTPASASSTRCSRRTSVAASFVYYDDARPTPTSRP